MPAGSETGILLHQVLEDLELLREKQSRHETLKKYLHGTHLEPWQEEIELLIANLLSFPLPLPSGTFTLSDVNPRKMRHEMEFLYSTENGFMKGFADLFFEHKGAYFLVDWKSNYLESYTIEALKETVIRNQYDLQAKIYGEAVKRYLKLYNQNDKYFGFLFIFIRGVNSQKKEGVFFLKNS
jgi:exodeoxyribonuclease V beta subunit